MKIAKERGFFCLSADEINSELLKTPTYIQKIAAAFPNAVKDGEVDRKALAAIVFGDESARAKLNSIAHPEINRRIAEFNESPHAVELPLFVEGGDEAIDEIVYVKAPILKRIARLRKGRGMSAKQAIARIKSQVPSSVLRAKSTIVINNSKSLALLSKNTNKAFDAIFNTYKQTNKR